MTIPKHGRTYRSGSTAQTTRRRENGIVGTFSQKWTQPTAPVGMRSSEKAIQRIMRQDTDIVLTNDHLSLLLGSRQNALAGFFLWISRAFMIPSCIAHCQRTHELPQLLLRWWIDPPTSCCAVGDRDRFFHT